MSKKSEMLNNFNAYNDGNKLIGCTSEFSLPDIETMTETISALGLLGEVEVPAIGRISAMEMEIPFLNLADDIFKLFNPVSGVSLTLRGSMQCVDPSTQVKSFTAMRIVVKGSCKKITGGSFKPGSPGNPSVTITVNYLLVEYEGKKKLEIDKLNGVFKVNDNDILSSITTQC